MSVAILSFFMDVAITKAPNPMKLFSSDGKRQQCNLFHFRLFRNNATHMLTFFLTCFIRGTIDLDGSKEKFFE